MMQADQKCYLAKKCYLALFAIMLVLPACKMIGPEYERPAVKQLPEQYAHQSATSTADAVPTQWWTLYQDAELNRLMAKALKQNPDIQLAVARIEEAEAQLNVVGASLLPNINLGGGGKRSRITEKGRFPAFGKNPQNEYDLALSSQFNLDFWGRLKRTQDATRAQYLGTHYAKHVVRLNIQSLVAKAYWQLRSVDAQMANVQASLAISEESLTLAKHREAGGIASMLDVHQATLVRDNLQLQVMQLKRDRKLLHHVLSALTLDTVVIAMRQPLTLPEPPIPPAGLPSDLLENRPDIQQAEQAMIAANANIGVAKAAFYPSIGLTSSLGGQSVLLSQLLKSPARVWSLGLAFDLPIFNGGSLDADVAKANAQQKQALQQYVGTVSTAFKEVNDALVNTQYYQENQALLASNVATAKAMLDIAQERYHAGYVSYLEVLQAQQSLIDAQQTQVSNQQQRLLASVDMFTSLGGGWDSDHLDADNSVPKDAPAN